MLLQNTPENGWWESFFGEPPYFKDIGTWEIEKGHDQPIFSAQTVAFLGTERGWGRVFRAA